MITKLVKIEDITVDQAVNVSRPEGLDPSVVSEYAQAMQNEALFPPLVVYDDGVEKWLASGFHRLEAAKSIGWLEFEAEVRSGGRAEAVKQACSDNAQHGKQRTNQGKRQQVKQMLKLESQWSDNQIARWCQVSQPFVSKLRNHTNNVISMDQSGLAGGAVSIEPKRTFIHPKTGQPARMQTGNIGRQAETGDAGQPPDDDRRQPPDQLNLFLEFHSAAAKVREVQAKCASYSLDVIMAALLDHGCHEIIDGLIRQAGALQRSAQFCQKLSYQAVFSSHDEDQLTLPPVRQFEEGKKRELSRLGKD